MFTIYYLEKLINYISNIIPWLGKKKVDMHSHTFLKGKILMVVSFVLAPMFSNMYKCKKEKIRASFKFVNKTYHSS